MELNPPDAILDLNVTCPNCGFAIPPEQINLIAPNTVRCPICHQAIALKPWVPIRFSIPE